MLHGVATAKLTLYLHILGKRSDGYHDLDALVAFADIGDEITVEASDTLQLSIDGPFADSLDISADDNLVMRAAQLLQTHVGIDQGAQITLNKQLPAAAGLGGGSADAATTLILLCRLWGTPVPLDALCALGLQLGADVPVCLYGVSAFISGIGDKVSPTTALPPLHAVLVNPMQPVSTPEVYAAYSHEDRDDMRLDILHDMSAEMLLNQLQLQRNDLQRPAISLCSVIAQVLLELDTMPLVRFARMVGSGATCVAWVEDVTAAQTVCERIKKAHPEWWVHPVVLQHRPRLRAV